MRLRVAERRRATRVDGSGGRSEPAEAELTGECVLHGWQARDRRRSAVMSAHFVWPAGHYRRVVVDRRERLEMRMNISIIGQKLRGRGNE